MTEGYWQNGAWIAPHPGIQQKLEVIQTSPLDTVIKLNGEKLRVISYSVSHQARELPVITLQLSGLTQLDITENEGEMYLYFKGMRFKRIE